MEPFLTMMGARASLKRAPEIAQTLENPLQVMQADLQLGSVMASEGHS